MLNNWYFIRKIPKGESRWKYAKKHLIRMSLALLVLVIMIMISAYQHLSSILYEKNPAYDVKNEYIAAFFLGGIRAVAINTNDGTEAAWTAPIKWIHKKVYESAIQKIPEEDGERDVWRLMYELRPLSYIDSKKAAEIMPDVLRDFDSITSKPFASKTMREFERYHYAYSYSDFFFDKRNLSNLTREENEYWENLLLSRSMSLLKMADVNNFISQRVEWEKMLLISYEILIYDRILERIISSNYSCQSDHVRNFLYLQENLRDSLKIYRTTKLRPNESKNFNLIEEMLRDRGEPLKDKLNYECDLGL